MWAHVFDAQHSIATWLSGIEDPLDPRRVSSQSKLRHAACVLALCALILPGCQTLQPIGVIQQEDAHTPLPWRSLTATEEIAFELGNAVFNTQWARAGDPPGRRDGLGPLFNAQSCDACHNSRRRGRGPRAEGAAPADLVIQLGRRLPDASVQRGSDSYGNILNTSATQGFAPEASVFIRYDEQVRTLDDGTQVSLRMPRYQISDLSGPALPSNTVLMPRMPPSVQGVGLLERVPQSELVTRAELAQLKGGAALGQVSWLTTQEGAVIGRFGWQATEPSVARQTASALSREMGLTTALVSHIDCGDKADCQSAATGGAPEVERELFDALVLFQRVHAVPVGKPAQTARQGEQLFVRVGCDECHRPTLPIATDDGPRKMIQAYTDLLLHDVGTGLADRDIEGNVVASRWRTAPLWGMQASVQSGQPLRLMHDGRARSIEEAILWHGGEADSARERYARLSVNERRALAVWIAEL